MSADDYVAGVLVEHAKKVTGKGEVSPSDIFEYATSAPEVLHVFPIFPGGWFLAINMRNGSVVVVSIHPSGQIEVLEQFHDNSFDLDGMRRISARHHIEARKITKLHPTWLHYD